MISAHSAESPDLTPPDRRLRTFLSAKVAATNATTLHHSHLARASVDNAAFADHACAFIAASPAPASAAVHPTAVCASDVFARHVPDPPPPTPPPPPRPHGPSAVL